MTPPLTAGDRLAAKSNKGGGRPPGPPRDDRGRKPRGNGPFRWLGRLVGVFAGLLVLAGFVGLIALYGAYRHYASDLPDVDGLKNYQPPVMSRVYAANDQLIAELATERRIFVPFTAIPKQVQDAFVAAEDQNFWTHHGVDPLAIARAAFTDFEHMGEGRRPIGASTITQQVAKNMLLGNQVTLARKVKEAILALRIEQVLSKERILEIYLNEIYLGQGAYGVAAAAQAYFNKPLDELDLAQDAFLAALPKAPNNYNPFRNPQAALDRRDWVLDRMADDRAITRAQADAAKKEPILPTAYRKPDTVQGADYFSEDIRQILVQRFGADKTTEGGLAVRTSLDPALQAKAVKSLRTGLMAYDHAHGGWRGASGHLDTPDLQSGWQKALAQAAPPPGMLPDWRLAVVLGVAPAEAKVGWVDVPPGPARADAPPPPAHTGNLYLSDLAWARPVHDGKPGAAPRRMADVVQVGDLVMIAPAPPPATGKAAAHQQDRVALEQIPAVEGALVSLDPRNGRVLALCGGWSFQQSQFDRATQANRQPGSSFKPFVYLTAMEQGISPSQRFLDAPFVVDLGAAGRWRPNDYEMDFSGPVSLHVALEKSLNLVTLRVADKVGMNAVAKTAIDFHVVDAMPKVLPAALGAVDTTVMRMAGAYASLDEGGRLVTPHLIDSVQDRDGHVIWKPDGLNCETCGGDPSQGPVLDDSRKQVSDADSTFQVVTMMEGVVQHGTGTAAGAGMNRPIAGKTGTTQDFNDAWFGGFTPDLVTVVWVGFDNPASLGEGETGGRVAAPIWHDYMEFALKNRPVLPFVVPDGVTVAQWDSGSGVVTDAFKQGQAPGASTQLGATAAESGAAGAADQPGAPGAPASGGGNLDTSMGGLY